MKNNLKQIESIFNASVITNNDIVSAMVNFRLVIEDQKVQSQFHYLNLYCNWTLHPRIEGSNIAFRILETISECLIIHNNSFKADKHLNDAIIEGLSLHKLHVDIFNFAKKYNISISKFQDYTFWLNIGTGLVEILSERPIVFPDTIKKGTEIEKIYNSIRNKAEISGSLANGVIELSFLNQNNELLWKIKTMDYKNKAVDIVGPVSIITQKMIDNYKWIE